MIDLQCEQYVGLQTKKAEFLRDTFLEKLHTHAVNHFEQNKLGIKNEKKVELATRQKNIDYLGKEKNKARNSFIGLIASSFLIVTIPFALKAYKTWKAAEKEQGQAKEEYEQKAKSYDAEFAKQDDKQVRGQWQEGVKKQCVTVDGFHRFIHDNKQLEP